METMGPGAWSSSPRSMLLLLLLMPCPANIKDQLRTFKVVPSQGLQFTFESEFIILDTWSAKKITACHISKQRMLQPSSHYSCPHGEPQGTSGWRLVSCLPPSPQPLQRFPAVLPERCPDRKGQDAGTRQPRCLSKG